MDARERYQEDPAFREIVDVMTHFMMRAEFTPSEIRLAAMLASLHFEMTRPARYLITPEIEKDFERLQKHINEVTENE